MRVVSCGTCGAGILARKSSWDQTSLQWTAEASARCAERATSRPVVDRPNRNDFGGCTALRASVREAAVRGELPVQSHAPLKVNQAGDQ